MHGIGTYTWPNGKKYEGNFFEDKREGHGLITWVGGKIYSGNWEKGK